MPDPNLYKLNYSVVKENLYSIGTYVSPFLKRNTSAEQNMDAIRNLSA